jgi:hypothetical protein
MHALLRRFTIRARFQLILAVTALALLTLGVWGMAANKVGMSTVSNLFESASAASEQAAKLRLTLSDLRLYEASMIAAAANTNEVERLHALWKQQLAQLKSLGDAMGAEPALAAGVKAQRELLDEYVATIGPVAEQLAGARIDAAAARSA